MSAFLVLDYCENGSLLSYMQAATTEIPPHKKLTFCAEVARGMDYISARRVIHRDLAARNVLLDFAMVCKIADFGLSIALNEVKEYARLKEGAVAEDELPVRWTAPEIFSENKFSTRSDVWAYGIFVWEVFSGGEEPYPGKNVLEVVSHVSNGGTVTTLPVDVCSISVHEKLIAACLRIEPADRPSFSNLYDVAIYHGGSPDDHAIQEQKLRRNSARVAQLSAEEILTNQGPSVHHLSTNFITGVCAAVEVVLPDITTKIKIYHMVTAFAKPKGDNVTCPRDNIIGAAYVDTLKGEDNVGLATALLSYSWGYNIQDVVDALSDWTEVQCRDPKRTYIWICSLCLNQHRMVAALSPEQLQQEFGDRVKSIGRVLPMIDQWEDPGYIKRAWCLFELFTAIRMTSVEIDIIVSPSQQQKVREAVQLKGFKCIDNALLLIRSENATATERADLEAIRALVLMFGGGFAALDRAVTVRLRSWFQDITGIRFAARLSRRLKPIIVENTPGKHVDLQSKQKQGEQTETQTAIIEETSFGKDRKSSTTYEASQYNQAPEYTDNLAFEQNEFKNDEFSIYTDSECQKALSKVFDLTEHVEELESQLMRLKFQKIKRLESRTKMVSVVEDSGTELAIARKEITKLTQQVEKLTSQSMHQEYKSGTGGAGYLIRDNAPDVLLWGLPVSVTDLIHVFQMDRKNAYDGLD